MMKIIKSLLICISLSLLFLALSILYKNDINNLLVKNDLPLFKEENKKEFTINTIDNKRYYFKLDDRFKYIDGNEFNKTFKYNDTSINYTVYNNIDNNYRKYNDYYFKTIKENNTFIYEIYRKYNDDYLKLLIKTKDYSFNFDNFISMLKVESLDKKVNYKHFKLENNSLKAKLIYKDKKVLISLPSYYLEDEVLFLDNYYKLHSNKKDNTNNIVIKFKDKVTLDSYKKENDYYYKKNSERTEIIKKIDNFYYILIINGPYKNINDYLDIKLIS